MEPEFRRQYDAALRLHPFDGLARPYVDAAGRHDAALRGTRRRTRELSKGWPRVALEVFAPIDANIPFLYFKF